MSEFDMTEDVVVDERHDDEEFEADEREAVSGETGTHYDPLGEAEATPQDLDAEDEAAE